MDARIVLIGLAAAGLGAQEWHPIRPIPVERPTVACYETVAVLGDFGVDLGGWHAVTGGQRTQATATREAQAWQDGTRFALRLDATYAGRDGLEYIEIGSGGKPLPEPGAGIGLWYRAEGIPANLRLRVRDSSGEMHQINLPREENPAAAHGWHYTAAMITDQDTAWGADGNRRLDYPCTLHSIVNDRPQRGYAGSGTLWLGEVAVVRPVPAGDDLSLAVAELRLGNLYLPGDSVRLRASAPRGRMTWEVLDYSGAACWSGTGEAPAVELAFGPLEQGWYACVVTLEQPDAPPQSVAFQCAALPDATAAPPNAFLGFCTHFQRHTAWPAEGLRLFRRYGFTELRDEVPWGAVETANGVLALPEDRTAYTATAFDLGIAPLIILDYGNPHYDDGGFPNSPEAVAGYARYGAFMARQLADRVRHVEVWNEWTVRCGMRDKPGSNAPEFYAAMLRAAYAAVKEANPEMTVVGIGGEHSDHHFANIEAMLANGAATAMDALSVHSYRYPRTPEETDLEGEIRRVLELAQRHGAPPRLWVTEIGWPTHAGPRGVDERRQAALLVRTLAILGGVAGVEKVFWYDFMDDGLTRDYNEHNFGVVRNHLMNWAPKPAVVAASVFARRTAGAACAGVQRVGQTHLATYTRSDGSQVGILWAAAGTPDVTLGGRIDGAFDLMGRPLAGVPRQAGNVPVHLSGHGMVLMEAGRAE